MSRRTGLVIAAGLILGLAVAFVIWHAARKDQLTILSPLVPAQTVSILPFSSPLSSPTTRPLSSPLPVPPTGTPAVNTATLEAIRATRPTATPPSPSSSLWPYVSPETWRRWALWTLALAGILAYIGLRLRQNQ